VEPLRVVCLLGGIEVMFRSGSRERVLDEIDSMNRYLCTLEQSESLHPTRGRLQEFKVKVETCVGAAIEQFDMVNEQYYSLIASDKYLNLLHGIVSLENLREIGALGLEQSEKDPELGRKRRGDLEKALTDIDHKLNKTWGELRALLK
jgi:hypothetical protein